MITAIVKTIFRPKCVKNLLESLYKYHPEMNILLADDSGTNCAKELAKFYPDQSKIKYWDLPYNVGISEGRNFLLSKVETPYFLQIDDDLIIIEESRINDMVAKLSTYDIVGGFYYENGAVVGWNGWFRRDGTNLVCESVPHWNQEYEVDCVQNFFVAKTDSVRKIGGWDENLKTMEHNDFFLRASQAGLKVLSFPSYTDHVRFSTREYTQLRMEEMLERELQWMDKHGIECYQAFSGRTSRRGSQWEKAKEVTSRWNLKIEDKKLIIGVGTGRCGTKSLSWFLSAQDSCSVTHEKMPVLPWTKSYTDIPHRIKQLTSRYQNFVGDIAYYYLNYIEDIFKIHPNTSVIGLRRDKQGTIESYMKWLKGVNQWNNERKHPVQIQFGRGYPKYPELPMEDAIAKYWDEYYEILESLVQKYPDKIKLFEMNDLNDEEKLSKILDFTGIMGNQKFKICHTNKSSW